MDKVNTYSGKRVDPFNPVVADVDIVDIAHQLSQKCRFNGATKHFYSVAEHSIFVAEQVSDPLKLWGLLHDGHEIWSGDQSRPIKGRLCVETRGHGVLSIEQWHFLELRLQKVIAEKFNLSWPMPFEVEEADDRMMVTEFRDLIHGEHESPFAAKPYDFTLCGGGSGLSSEAAKVMFLNAFERYSEERG